MSQVKIASIPPKGFLDAMQEHGLTPDPCKIIPGVFFRFPGAGKGKTSLSGWSKLFDDGRGGVFGDYSTNIKGSWQERHGKKMTPAEQKEYQAMVEKAFQESREATKKRQETGAENASKIWMAARRAPSNHPYLVKKGIQDALHSVREYQGPLVIRDMACNGALIIPAYDEAGKLSTLEFIQTDGEKRFLPGCKKGGAFFLIGYYPFPYDDKGGVICITEGYATGSSIHQAIKCPVIVAFDAGNLLAVAIIMRKRHPAAQIVICADNDHHEDGTTNTGLVMASRAAKAMGGLVAIPELINGDKTDFNDMAQHPDGDEMIRACISSVLVDSGSSVIGQNSPGQNSPGQPGSASPGQPGSASPGQPGSGSPGQPEAESRPETKKETPEETVARLATLPPLVYDRVRQMEADLLGVRTSTLDKEVAAARGNGTDKESGQAVIFEEFEPWPVPVDGAALLDELAATFKRFVVLPPHADKTLSLWCLLTYLTNSVDVLPILNITSPEKRCGKSTLLTTVNCLVNRPLLASSITPSAMFRSIDLWSPSLLIDEADTFITSENEGLRGVINSGHTRDTAYIIRNCGDNHEPRRFSTWGAKVLCGIGQLPGTVKDRSILIELKRRTNNEPIEKMRYVNADTFSKIKRKMARFAADIRFKITKHRPDIPGLLHDRAGDNWGPLLSIAHFAGGVWPDLARSAALSLVGVEKEAISVNVELLADIKTVFESLGVDHLPTENLIDGLCENQERPWATWNKGEPISARQLSKKLSGFEISPKVIRLSENKTLRGYELRQFNDSFSRYTLSYP